jgi:uracil-DNA glycosylase
MGEMTDLLKLKYLKSLKSLGFSYTAQLEDFDTPCEMALPNDIAKLKTIALSCHLCDLAKTRKSVVFGEGNLNARIMFVGEGPGESEDSSGRPFVGKAGELLTAMIEKAIEVPRESVYITNLLKCRSSQNRESTHAEIMACKNYLIKQIELVDPTVIVCLGDIALNSLLGGEFEIAKVRGMRYSFGSKTVIPTYHPSYLLRNPSAKKEAYEDMLLIKSLLADSGS